MPAVIDNLNFVITSSILFNKFAIFDLICILDYVYIHCKTDLSTMRLVLSMEISHLHALSNFTYLLYFFNLNNYIFINIIFLIGHQSSECS